MAADGSDDPELLLTGENLRYPASWSPDGGTLAFYLVRPETQRDLWMVSAAGADPVEFVSSPFQEMGTRFSPNHRWVAYVSDETGRDELYL